MTINVEVVEGQVIVKPVVPVDESEFRADVLQVASDAAQVASDKIDADAAKTAAEAAQAGAEAVLLYGVRPVATIAALRSDTGDEKLLYVSGHTTERDGGEGLFQWVDQALTEDYGITIVRTDGEVYQRIWDGIAANVLWFGAKGDYDVDAQTGTSDSLAFNRALAAATQVYVPPGRAYGIGSQVGVPVGGRLFSTPNPAGIRYSSVTGWEDPTTTNVALLCVTFGAASSDNDNAAVTVDDRALVDGLSFVYPAQDMEGGTPVVYPATIAGPTGANTGFIATVKNNYFSNSYEAISFVDEGSDHTIDDNMGYAISKGIVTSGQQAGPKLNNNYFSPSYAYSQGTRPAGSLDRWTQDNGYGYEFGSMDWPEANSCTAFGYAAFANFVEGTGGDEVITSQIVFVNCRYDACKVGFRNRFNPRGIRILGGTGSAFSNYDGAYVGQHWDWVATGNGQIQVHGFEFRGGAGGTISGCVDVRMDTIMRAGLTLDTVDRAHLDLNIYQASGLDGVTLNDVQQVSGTLQGNSTTAPDLVITGTTAQMDMSVLSDQVAADAVDISALSHIHGRLTVIGTDSTLELGEVYTGSVADDAIASFDTPKTSGKAYLIINPGAAPQTQWSGETFFENGGTTSVLKVWGGTNFAAQTGGATTGDIVVGGVTDGKVALIPTGDDKISIVNRAGGSVTYELRIRD